MNTYRASELGRCIKASVAALLGYEPLPTSEQVQGWYDRGIAHEAECLDVMAAEGWYVSQQLAGWETDENQILVKLLIGGALITGHLDGIATGYDPFNRTTCVLEIKAPTAWATFERAVRPGNWADPYAFRMGTQISCYMLATGLEAVVACVDDGRLKTFGIEVPPFSWAEIERRVETIETLVRAGELPAACEKDDYPCPFAYLHEAQPVAVDEELDALVSAWHLLDKQAKQLTDSAKAARDRVQAKMGDTEKIVTNLATVSVYEQAGPATWDQDAMKADGVWEKYRVPGKSSRRMKITMRGSRS